MKYQTRKKALILLADGTIFYGKTVGGKKGSAFGEVCFNTGMTGYQEIFTDPSYFGQLMVATNAHIGNYGTAAKEVESDGIILRNVLRKFLPDGAGNLIVDDAGTLLPSIRCFTGESFILTFKSRISCVGSMNVRPT